MNPWSFDDKRVYSYGRRVPCDGKAVSAIVDFMDALGARS